MKKLLVILLLFIFSAQGVTVAAGGGGPAPDQEFALQCDGEASPGLGQLTEVAADMEEMSDYVALEPESTDVDRRTAPVRLQTHGFASIDLPRAPPPPRA